MILEQARYKLRSIKVIFILIYSSAQVDFPKVADLHLRAGELGEDILVRPGVDPFFIGKFEVEFFTHQLGGAALEKLEIFVLAARSWAVFDRQIERQFHIREYFI